MGAGIGQSRRRTPLTYKGGRERLRSPTRRGGGSLYGVDLHGKGKGKKGSISNIFQTSVTALSFLAFGGYLLCLIVQAIRSKNNGTAMMNGAALNANLSRFVFIGRRPASGKRRKRDSRDEDINTKHLKRKMPEECTLRGSTERSVSDAFTAHFDYKHVAEPRPADEMGMARSKDESATAVGRNFGSNDTQEFSGGPQRAGFNQTELEHESDEGTVETIEELDNAEHRDDVVQLGLWPMANVDDLYRALLMIAEGYSQYHHKLHTG
jgi:hypothetical protein